MSHRIAPVLVMAVVLIAAIMSITPWPVGSIQDDATYVILAKALATGEGYRQLDLPGMPRVVHYPPGYPIFLAALWKLWPDFPNNVVVFKYANAILLSLGALGAYAFARTRAKLGVISSALAAISGTICVLVLYVTGVVLSEPLFIALLFPALIVSEGAVNEGKVPNAVAAGALGGALALVRTIGIALLPALVLTLLLRRRLSAAIAALATGIGVLAPWQLWSAAHDGDVPGSATVTLRRRATHLVLKRRIDYVNKHKNRENTSRRYDCRTVWNFPAGAAMNEIVIIISVTSVEKSLELPRPSGRG